MVLVSEWNFRGGNFDLKGMQLYTGRTATQDMKSRIRSGDWVCPQCNFVIWASKLKCLKCGSPKPVVISDATRYNIKPKEILKLDPDRYGPYSYAKGGYYGEPLSGEPEGLKYPKCGCSHLENCPKRHHVFGCRCYTCRGKTHKW